MKTLLYSFLTFFLFLPVWTVNAAQSPLWKLEQAGVNAGYDTTVMSPEPIIASVIRAALSFLGVLFLLLIIYGGFRWMIAQGNEEDVKKAKSILMEATVGLIIVMLSYAITVFITARLTSGTGAQF